MPAPATGCEFLPRSDHTAWALKRRDGGYLIRGDTDARRPGARPPATAGTAVLPARRSSNTSAYGPPGQRGFLDQGSRGSSHGCSASRKIAASLRRTRRSSTSRSGVTSFWLTCLDRTRTRLSSNLMGSGDGLCRRWSMPIGRSLRPATYGALVRHLPSTRRVNL